MTTPSPTTPRQRRSPEKIGALIGAIAGAVFVFVNSASSPLAVAVTLRAAALVALVIVVAAVGRPADPAPANRDGPVEMRRVERTRTRGFWVVAGLELLAILAGRALLVGPLDRPDAAVAWISLVVGAHFLALAKVLKQPLFAWLGAALFLCGSTGLVLAGVRSEAVVVDLVGGVLPGAILMGYALRSSTGDRAQS